MLAMMTLTACNQAQRAAFDKERSEKKYQSAQADLTAGQTDAAIEGFSDAVKSDPGNASARFQLAVLLQDYKKDYLGAICHYRDYLLLAPESDKAALARERTANCERLLATDLAEKHNLTDNAKVVADLRQAEQERDEALAKAESASAELAKVREELEVAVKRYNKVQQIIARMDEEDLDRPKATVVHEEESGAAPRPVRVLTEEVETSRTGPNPEALKLNEEAEREETDPLIRKPSDGEIKALKAEAKANKEVKADPAAVSPDRPQRGHKYTIKEGDTLSKIALEVYGKKSEWVRIQHANKTTTTVNGDVKVGVTIDIP